MSVSFEKICSNLIPTGKYKVQVTDIKFRLAATGEPSKDMMVTYTIVDGPCAKRTIVDTIYEKSFGFRLKPFLTACKVDLSREFATADELYHYGLATAKNKIILIDIGTRTYNGKEYNQISDFYPLPDSTVSFDDVMESFGDVPDVKGESAAPVLDGKVEEEMNIPEEAEPELDVNLDTGDIDNPF